jgi:hypothetical protein
MTKAGSTSRIAHFGRLAPIQLQRIGKAFATKR